MNELQIGVAECEITPSFDRPVYLAGGLHPTERAANGVHDKLMVRSIALQSGENCLVYSLFDLCILTEDLLGVTVAELRAETGLPGESLVWSCSHSHSAPVTQGIYPSAMGDGFDTTWFADVLAQYKKSVHQALADRQPAAVTRLRGFAPGLVHNRRVRFKNGRDINTWLLNNVKDVQSVGNAAVTDPEVGILAFDREDGTLAAVLYHFSLHANLRGGREISADYPGVVAAALKKKYGNHLIPLYMPGACGDINRVKDCDSSGTELADVMIRELEKERSGKSRTHVQLGMIRQRKRYPLRDLLSANEEKRLAASKWRPEHYEYFRASLAELRAAGKTEVETVLSCWHLNETAFVGVPGELFVEHGLRLKQESPFPWTWPVELCNDWQGYFITQAAWKAIGYEGLTASTGKITPEAVEQMMTDELNLLQHLARRQALSATGDVAIKLKQGSQARIRLLAPDDGERLADFYSRIPPEDNHYYCPHPLDREHALRNAAASEEPGFVCLVLIPDATAKSKKNDEEIAGYAWYRWPSGAVKSSFGICIRRDYQGAGAGRILITKLLELARLIGPPVMSLTAQKANSGAVRLYQKMGFTVQREQQRGGDGEPEYYMEKEIEKI